MAESPVNLAGNYLVPGEPFDVSKINTLNSAVMQLQSTTSNLQNTVATSTGATKTTVPVIWGTRVKVPMVPSKDSAAISFDWGKSPYTSTEYGSGNLICVATLADDKEGANDFRISITSSGEPKLYVYWAPENPKTAKSTSKYINVMFFYNREVAPTV